MVKSYISAIKVVLLDNNIQINEDVYLLHSLMRACRIKYDRVNVRRPIQKDVLNILLKMTDTYFRVQGQPYLAKLYTALFATAYYGLFRIGELTLSHHTVKACNVHIGENKRKIQFKYLIHIENSRTE